MQPVSDAVTIDRPLEDVFDYLADIANHPEFLDHCFTDWRLTRVDSRGSGAGARFKIQAPLQRFLWADLSFAQVERPYRIVAVGRGGKFNRIKLYEEWLLSPAGDATRVRLTFDTEPALPTDRLMELLGQRAWFKRNLRKALARLQRILEEDADRGQRATIAGGQHW